MWLAELFGRNNKQLKPVSLEGLSDEEILARPRNSLWHHYNSSQPDKPKQNKRYICHISGAEEDCILEYRVYCDANCEECSMHGLDIDDNFEKRCPTCPKRIKMMNSGCFVDENGEQVENVVSWRVIR